MKNFDLASMGVHEMSTLEMKETDGGIIWILIAAGLVLLGTSSCGNNSSLTINIGTGNSADVQNNGTVSADSTLNGNSVSADIMPLPKR